MIPGVFLLAAAIAAFVLIGKWPFTRGAMLATLQKASGRTVTIGRFHQTFIPPGCVAEDVEFERHVHKDLPPLIAIKRLEVRSTYLGLLSHSISKVIVTGMHVTLPKGPTGKRANPVALNASENSNRVIDEIVADGTQIDFLPGLTGPPSYSIKVKQFRTGRVAANSRIGFHALLDISKPVSELEADGSFGPWKPSQAPETPVAGTFRVVSSDLGILNVISGIANAKGTFNGKLRRIEVNGSSDVPNFKVRTSSHVENFATTFRTVVDATKGDVQLESTESHVGRTAIESRGTIAGPDSHKTVNLDMGVDGGRIDDLMKIFIQAKQSPIVGTITLRAKAVLPPDEGTFLHRLKMAGDFGIGGGRFTNPRTQTPLNRLSHGAEGESREAEEHDPRPALSNMRGHVVLKDGVATFTRLMFEIDGAQATLSGTFNVENKVVDLHGTLATTGRLSDTTSGFKSVLVKIISPFFKKRHATVVPFKITGTYSNSKIGLDLGHKRH